MSKSIDMKEVGDVLQMQADHTKSGFDFVMQQYRIKEEKLDIADKSIDYIRRIILNASAMDNPSALFQEIIETIRDCRDRQEGT